MLFFFFFFLSRIKNGSLNSVPVELCASCIGNRRGALLSSTLKPDCCSSAGMSAPSTHVLLLPVLLQLKETTTTSSRKRRLIFLRKQHWGMAARGDTAVLKETLKLTKRRAVSFGKPHQDLAAALCSVSGDGCSDPFASCRPCCFHP